MSAVLSEATKLRDEIVRVGKSLFDRGMTFGSTGNISARLTSGELLMTPTNVSLGDLEPGRLSLIGADGVHLSGDAPTKEANLHQCMYCNSDRRIAVIHLHSTHAVAISILQDVNSKDVLPPLTAYYVMRIGSLPLVPYFPPGDSQLAEAVARLAQANHALLLANHGPVVSGTSLRDAQYAIEELEETAKLHLLLHGHAIRPLTAVQRDYLLRDSPTSDKGRGP